MAIASRSIKPADDSGSPKANADKVDMDRIARQLLSSPGAIRYFDEVAKAGSFRRAGAVLRITPSSVHRQITMLEQRLGTQLFERQPGRRGLKLTAAGEVLKLRVTEAFDLLMGAAEEIHALSDAHRGRAAIGVNDTLASDVLVDFIGAYHEAVPRLDFDVQLGDSEDLGESLLNGKLDMILCFGPPSHLGLRTLWQRRLTATIVVHKKHPLASRASVTPGECAQYPLAVQSDSEWTRGFGQRIFRESGYRPRFILRTNSFSMMRRMVSAGEAISLQTQLVGFRATEDDDLVFVPLKMHTDNFSNLACCISAERTMPAPAYAFAEALITSLESGINVAERAA